MLRAWRDWTAGVPDEMTSVGRIMQFPPLPFFPDEIRGKSFVLVEAIWCGPMHDGELWLEPLRALGPVIDTVQTIPITQLSHLHMDPEGPPRASATVAMLTALDDEAIDELIAGTVGAPILSTEVRHLGGAVARPAREHGALASFEAPYADVLGRDRSDAGGCRPPFAAPFARSERGSSRGRPRTRTSTSARAAGLRQRTSPRRASTACGR